MFICQRINTTHDTNGNPRRLWVLYQIEAYTVNPMPRAVISEGYSGRPESCRGIPELPNINVSPSEYRVWMKLGKSLKCYQEQS